MLGITGKNKAELLNDVHLLYPTHELTTVGRLSKSFINQHFEDNR